MFKEIIIVGAGMNGLVVKNILAQDKNNQIIGFLDNFKKGKDILGKIKDFKKFKGKNRYFFVSLGDNKLRKSLFMELKKNRANFINAIHPTAYIETDVVLGKNVMIGALSYINVNSVIGDNTFINNGCVIEHDNLIKNHCHIAPGAIIGGRVKIGHTSFIGLGTRINDRITIGNNVIIGSGAVVINNIKSNATAIGVPAKIIK